MTRSLALFAVATLLLTFPAFAQPRTPEARNVPRVEGKEDAPANADSKYSLTIYSAADNSAFDPSRMNGGVAQLRSQREPLPGYAVVREIRRIELKAGENIIRFSDVAAGIDPTTVSFKSLTAPASTRVLEQNFEYDLVSPDKLLEKYLGRSIIINRKQTPLAAETTRIPDTIEGKLLSFTADQLVLQTNNKQLPVQVIPRNGDIQEMKLFELQTGLMTRPTLVWKLESTQAGPHDVLVSYQTSGVAWRADYGLTLSKDEKTAELSAWVSVLNESGASYKGARLKLVAGDVHRIDPPARSSGGLFGGGGGRGGDTGFKERSFFDYHLYTLGRPTSLADNSAKQIELFPAKAGIPVEHQYIYDGAGIRFAGYRAQIDHANNDDSDNSTTKVDVYLKFANSEKSGLGMPLPAGRMRVYKLDDADAEDPAGSQEFLGEDALDHTPKDEQVLARVGTAFDLVGEHKQTDYTEDRAARFITETYEITLKNHKKEAAHITVRETLSRWHNWSITSNDKFEKRNAHTIVFPADIPAGGEKKVTYTVKYTW